MSVDSELFLTQKKLILKKKNQKIIKFNKNGKKRYISSKYKYNKIKLIKTIVKSKKFTLNN